MLLKADREGSTENFGLEIWNHEDQQVQI